MTTQIEVRLTFVERLHLAISRMGGRGKVAEFFGVDPSTVSRWTSGETVPPVMTMRALSMAADLPYEWLRPAEDDPQPGDVVRPLGLEPRTR